MGEIARYTTPAITYKPSMVEIEYIDEIFLVVKQGNREILRKNKDDASISKDGFTWVFSQTDTAALNSKAISTVQIDYTSGAMRYTTYPRPYAITESAISEVI